MFNLGFSEMLVIAILAIVLIGPKQLPEVAKMFGRFLNEFRRTTDAFKDEFAESSRKIMDSTKVDSQTTPTPQTPEPPKNDQVVNEQSPAEVKPNPAAEELAEQYSSLASPETTKKEKPQS